MIITQTTEFKTNECTFKLKYVKKQEQVGSPLQKYQSESSQLMLLFFNIITCKQCLWVI